MYEYRARIVRVIDGDTVEAEIDLGFRLAYRVTVRLAGINAPEIRGPERSKGLASARYLRALIQDRSAAGWLVLRTHKDATEKYGRYLAELIAAGASLNELLVQAGHAVPYEG